MKATKPTNDSRLMSRARRAKDNNKSTQRQLVYQGFFKQPMTMQMLSVHYSLDRANVCWYVKELRESGKIKSIRKAPCAITRTIANYWTTNEKLFPVNKQTQLF